MLAALVQALGERALRATPRRARGSGPSGRASPQAGVGMEGRTRSGRCGAAAAGRRALAAALATLAALAAAVGSGGAADVATDPSLFPMAGNLPQCQRVFARNETFPPLMYLKLYKVGGGAFARVLAPRCFAYHAKVLAERCGAARGEAANGCPSADEMCAALPMHVNHESTLGVYNRYGRCSLATIGSTKSTFKQSSVRAATQCMRLPAERQVPEGRFLVTMREPLSRVLSSLFFWANDKEAAKLGLPHRPIPCLKRLKRGTKPHQRTRAEMDKLLETIPYGDACVRAFHRLNSSIGAEWTARDIDSFYDHFTTNSFDYIRQFTKCSRRRSCHDLEGEPVAYDSCKTELKRCATNVQALLERDFIVGLTHRFEDSITLAAHMLGWRLDSMQYGRVHVRHKLADTHHREGGEGPEAPAPAPQRTRAEQLQRAARMMPPALEELSEAAVQRLREREEMESLVYERAVLVFEQQWQAAGAERLRAAADEFADVMDRWDECEHIGTLEQRLNTPRGGAARRGCASRACTLGRGCPCEPDLGVA